MIERMEKRNIQIVILTAGMSMLPFASQVKLIANVEYSITPVKLNNSPNLVFKRKYNPIFPRIAKSPVIIKIDNSVSIPNLKRRDVKKQITGDRYIVCIEFIFVPVKYSAFKR